MSREVWRDHPEYLGLWRMARQEADEPAHRFVLADWLEENGQHTQAWRERLHGLTGNIPGFDPDAGIVRAGEIPMGQGAWRRLLAAPSADEVLCVFKRDPSAYQYLRQYRGRCGWNVGQSDWSSLTEREHLLAVPRLELLASHLLDTDSWDWVMENMAGLTHFEADVPMIDEARIAGLKRLPRLCGLLLHGPGGSNLDALDCLPGLRWLSLCPYPFNARSLATLAPELEWLNADLLEIGDEMLWPRLRCLRLHGQAHWPPLQTAELTTLALHPLLQRLDVRCGKVKASAIKAVAESPHLRELTLRFESAPPPSLKALAKATALESLTIEGPVNQDRLAEIANVSSLLTLSLGQVAADGRDVAALSELTNLEELRLAGEGEYDSAMRGLAALPKLTKLDVQYLKMAPKTARAVKKACPPWVECLVPSEE